MEVQSEYVAWGEETFGISAEGDGIVNLQEYRN